MYNRSLSSSFGANVRNSILCSFILLLSSVAALADEFCPVHYWWDHERDDCIRCTVCDDQSIVLRSCQPHQDVVCGTLSDLEYDLNWLTAIGEPKQQRVSTIHISRATSNAIHSQLHNSVRLKSNEMQTKQKIIIINSIFPLFFFHFVWNPRVLRTIIICASLRNPTSKWCWTIGRHWH